MVDASEVVTLGAFRDLSIIDPSLSGLPLPNFGNFPGRIDVGVDVAPFDRYDLVLAKPLSDAVLTGSIARLISNGQQGSSDPAACTTDWTAKPSQSCPRSTI